MSFNLNKVFNVNFPIVDIDSQILKNTWFICSNVKMFNFFSPGIFENER